MGCAVKVYKGQGVMFMCGSGVEPCSVCGDLAVSLCDYPVGPRETCDQPLCEKHSIKQGSEWQDIHFCPTHVLIADKKINTTGVLKPRQCSTCRHYSGGCCTKHGTMKDETEYCRDYQ